MRTQTIPLVYCRRCDSTFTDLSLGHCPHCAGKLCELLATWRPCRLAMAAHWALRAGLAAIALGAVLAAALAVAVAR